MLPEPSITSVTIGCLRPAVIVVEAQLDFEAAAPLFPEPGPTTSEELPAVGKKVTGLNPFGSIESVKATMDLITPVSGEITEVNANLNDHPEKVNEDPYGEGWMIVVTMSNPTEINSLLSAAEYKTFTETEAAG